MHVCVQEFLFRQQINFLINACRTGIWMLWRECWEWESGGQRLPTCIQERPEFQGQRGLFGNKLVHVTSHIYMHPIYANQNILTNSSIITNIAAHLSPVGASSWSIPLPAPMESIQETRYSLSPVRLFNGGYCFLCCHRQKIWGDLLINAPISWSKDFET
jgi:hypothetical protein